MSNSLLEKITHLKNKLPTLEIITEKSDTDNYARDWTTYFKVSAGAVLFPENTDDVISIIKWANDFRVPLVPSGGRTGLSGGACALNGEVVVSLQKMRKVLEFNAVEQTLLCQAGVVTETIQNEAHQRGLYYPVDFAARGSSHIGGNVATNAGGIRVLRYGLTRNWIASLKVVTGKGDLLHLGKGLIKDATGPQLIHLFIGSEGILGIVTEVEVKLTTPPPPKKVLLLQSHSLTSIINCFGKLRSRHNLQAFEFFSQLGLDHVVQKFQLSPPFPEKAPFYFLTEIETPTHQEIEKVFESLEDLFQENLIVNGTMAESTAQERLFWSYREHISEALSPFKPYKNDISVRIGQIPQFIPQMDTLIKHFYPDWEVVWFGHIGDGNLHINILKPDYLSPEEFFEKCQTIDKELLKLVGKMGGAISAEHGVGITKKPNLHLSKSSVEIETLKLLKSWFDPNNILNPGKVL